MCLNVLPACMQAQHVCAWCSHRSEEGVGSQVLCKSYLSRPKSCLFCPHPKTLGEAEFKAMDYVIWRRKQRY